MSVTLTTITPVWDSRYEQMFDVWAKNLEAAHVSGLQHLVFCPGLKGKLIAAPGRHFEICFQGQPGDSIGWFHNAGARIARTEWIMKLDLDAMVNPSYFENLFAVLSQARPREWFNGGMIYINQTYSRAYLDDPVTPQGYQYLMARRSAISQLGGRIGGSNFICRREDYLATGGCDPRFRGWGWEDYQQTFSLEVQFRDRLPWPEVPPVESITAACRDMITRPKAEALLRESPWLCLLHHYHETSPRNHSLENRTVLWDCVRRIYERRRASNQAKAGSRI